jgi:AraC-like DNA-binding protein
MNSRDENLSLPQVLEKSIIPWAQQGGMARIFTALPRWEREMELPPGFSVTRRDLRGPRIPVRASRFYGGATIVDAQWPEDNMHSARTPKLYFVLEGPVAMRVADYVVHCRTGHGIFLPPGIPFANDQTSLLDDTQPHRGVYELLQIMPYHGGVLCWKTQSRCDQSGNKQSLEETSSIPHSQVTFYLHYLMNEATTPNPHRRLICDSLLNIVVALLHRELQQLPTFRTGTMNPGPRPAPAEHREYSIAQAQQYIENNLRETLSIDRVARFACMSRTAFTEQFRARTGKTFAQYVTDRRFEEAKKILSGTDLAVLHVGLLVGLKPNRMRVLFQEREGCSPLAFRYKHRCDSL